MRYNRISKAVARKKFENGEKIGMLPCKAVVGSMWFPSPLTVAYDKNGVDGFDSFEKAVNSFSYYNCNSQLGYYPHYYEVVAE